MKCSDIVERGMEWSRVNWSAMAYIYMILHCFVNIIILLFKIILLFNYYLILTTFQMTVIQCHPNFKEI